MTHTLTPEGLLPNERQFRVVEELPGNTRATTRPCYVVAYIQDDGEVGVATSHAENDSAVLALAAAVMQLYADRVGMTLVEAAADAVTGLNRVGGLKVRAR